VALHKDGEVSCRVDWRRVVGARRGGVVRDVDARLAGSGGESRVSGEESVLPGELLPSCVVGVEVRWAAVYVVR
jgi:hypothetical protein